MSQLSQPLHLLSLSVFLGGLGACSSSNGGPSGGDVPLEGPPLLQRPTQKTFDCSVKSPTSKLNDPGAARAALVPIASNNHVAYSLNGSEFNGNDFIRHQGIRWSTIALDGTLGAPTSVSESAPYSLVAAVQGSLVSILWSQYESEFGERLWSAQVDANGQLAGTPKPIWTVTGKPGSLRLVNADGQLALFWVEDGRAGQTYGGQAASGYRVFYGQLNASGDFAEAPKPILVDENETVIVATAPYGDAYSIAYVVRRDKVSQLHYVLLDRSGAARSPAVLVDPSSVALWLWGSSAGMIIVDDRVLLASVANSATSRVIHIHRLDTAGNRLGAAIALQAPVADEENISPTWVKLDDGHVGLIWSKGSIIYSCGGCQPDNHLQFVILNSDTLQPSSEVIDLAPNSTSGGLIDADAVWSAPNLFLATAIQHHTSSEAASAAIECVAH